MTDDDIEKALSASGDSPHALLRVLQAVGWLLFRRERREAAAPTAEPEAPARAKTPSHGMKCDSCGEPATVGCKGCDIASCDECEAGFLHGGYAKRHALAEITEPWQRGLAARRQ